MFTLGQAVEHIDLGVTVFVAGIVEPVFGAAVLVDWDGSGALRFWCQPEDLAPLTDEREAA